MHRISRYLTDQHFRALVSVVAHLHPVPVPVLGQRSAGEVRLEVKDPSGAAVEASGRLENLATGADQTFQTDAQGRYAFRNLALWPLPVASLEGRIRHAIPFP